MTKDKSAVALCLWSLLVALQAGSRSVNPNHSRGGSENILDLLSKAGKPVPTHPNGS